MKKLVILLVLCGCASKDPVENIIDNNIGHFNEVVNYAKDNFEQTQEVMFLENELESCVIVLEDVKQAYYSQIDGCESKVDYWRMVSFFLGLIILGGILVKIKRVL